MNRSVCEVCRRFEPDSHKRFDVWMCAETVWLEKSDVIPGHRFVIRDNLHYMTADCQIPEWCERTLEQTILSADETVEVTPDAQLVFDGNHAAEHRHKQKMVKWGGF